MEAQLQVTGLVGGPSQGGEEGGRQGEHIRGGDAEGPRKLDLLRGPAAPPCPRGRVPGLGLPKCKHVPCQSPLGSTDQHDARVGEGSVHPRTSGR